MPKFIDITETWFEPWLEMALALWPDEKSDGLRIVLNDLISSPNHKNIIAMSDNEQPIGFANFSIKNDYIEGSETNRVGFVEGVYIKPEFRGQGIGKQLLQLGERWASSRGCTEMGSDAYITNMESRLFHKKSGFSVAGEIVCFIKKIGK